MITAAEALEKSKQAQVDFIESLISGATTMGAYEAGTARVLSEENMNMLRTKGFKIKQVQNKQGNLTIINWE